MLSTLALLLGLQVVNPPARLDASTFAQVKAHASPSAQDLAFQGIDWKPSIFDAVVEAQQKDKPVLMWLYFGDPRGHC